MRQIARTWTECSPAAVLANLRRLRSHAGPRVRLMAVVKADAYGHGADLVAPRLSAEVDAFGVANVAEALGLRALGVRQPLHVLSPLLPGEEESLIEADAIPFVASREEAERLQEAARRRERRLEVHLKVDTGMGRSGCPVDQAGPLLERLSASPWLRLAGLATHLACADKPECELNREQLRRFLQVRQHPLARSLPCHAANSAALLRLAEARFTLARPGLALYGISPFADDTSPILLEPALTWKTRVAQVRDFPAGATLSYGATVRLARPARIALLTVGYADGYPWSASNQASVLVGGRRAPVIGRVCMDLTLIEVTGLPPVRVGQEAVLLGRQGNESVPAEELARRAGMIPYEVLTRIGPRAPRQLADADRESADHGPDATDGFSPRGLREGV